MAASAAQQQCRKFERPICFATLLALFATEKETNKPQREVQLRWEAGKSLQRCKVSWVKHRKSKCIGAALPAWVVRKRAVSELEVPQSCIRHVELFRSVTGALGGGRGAGGSKCLPALADLGTLRVSNNGSSYIPCVLY